MLSFPSTWNDWFTRKKLPNQNLTFINLFPSTEEPLHCNMIHKKQLDFSYNKRIFSVFLVIVQCCFQALGWILKKLLVYLIMRNVDKALPTNIQYLITNLQKKNWRFWSISTTIYMVRVILVVLVLIWNSVWDTRKLRYFCCIQRTHTVCAVILPVIPWHLFH